MEIPRILTDNSQSASLSSVESSPPAPPPPPPPPPLTDKKVPTSSESSLSSLSILQSSLRSPGCSRKSSEVSFDRVVCSAANTASDSASRKRTLSCSTTATAHSTASSYTSYNLDESDADHMAYLESR